MKATIEDYIHAKEHGLLFAGRKVAPKTAQTYFEALLRAERLANDKELRLFIRSDINAILRNAETEGLAQSTINQTITAMKGFFAWAVGNSYLATDPTLAVQTQRVNRKLPELLTDEELDRFFGFLRLSSEKYYLVFRLMYTCGLRISEAVSLKRRCVLEQGIVVLGKGNKERFIPVTEDLMKALRVFMTKHTKSRTYVFYQESGPKKESDAITVNGARHSFEQAVSNAGITKLFTPHTLRHMFATRALSKTGRIEIVKELLGHENIQTTTFYIQLSTDEIQSAYKKIWD